MTLILENPELEARLQAETTRRGVRLEDLALEALETTFARRKYRNLDFLIGTWTAEEAEEFERNTAVFNTIDEAH